MGRLPLTPLALAPAAMVVSVVTLGPGRAVRVAISLVSHAFSSNVFVAMLDPGKSFRETFTA